MGDSDSRYFPSLDHAFDRALEPQRNGREPLALLFSGGVDSSLLAWELQGRRELTLFTVGVEGSRDLAAGSSAAELLELPWESVRLAPEELAPTAERLSDLLEGQDAVSRTVLLALGVALERCPHRLAMAGQGADELFLGYAHFRGLSPQDAAARSEADLEKLVERDWPATVRIARRFDREVIAPYLDPEFRRAARCVPIERRLPQPSAKSFFRRWAVHRGLSEVLAERPKRAFQYGSGIARHVRERSG